MKTIEKVNKRAWEEIKKIQESTNMIDVSSLINNAILKTFGLWNLGLLKIKIGNNERFETIREYRHDNLDKYGKEAKCYLITFIPQRLKKTIMFNEIIKTL